MARDFYKITVRGVIPSNVQSFFDGMNIEIIRDKKGNQLTVLSGPVKDQSELIGIINMLFDLNYFIQSVESGLIDQLSDQPEE